MNKVRIAEDFWGSDDSHGGGLRQDPHYAGRPYEDTLACHAELSKAVEPQQPPSERVVEEDTVKIEAVHARVILSGVLSSLREHPKEKALVRQTQMLKPGEVAIDVRQEIANNARSLSSKK